MTSQPDSGSDSGTTHDAARDSSVEDGAGGANFAGLCRAICCRHGCDARINPSAFKTCFAASYRAEAQAVLDYLQLGLSDASPTPAWLPVERAPKDGTWICLWRKPSEVPRGARWEPLILGRWDAEYDAWVWPDDIADVFTPLGREIADEQIADGGCYSAAPDGFTHWQPLPPPPSLIGGNHE